MGFTARLKAAVTGDADARFVYVGNVEVERQWAIGSAGLPRMSFGASDMVVNRMDELTLTLAGGADFVLLKTAPDPDYLAYLRDLGFALPTVISVGTQEPRRMVTEDALLDEATLAALRALGSDVWYLPHGVSTLEEQLVEATGVPLATPDAATCRAVNSKVYSRRVADEVGLRQPLGWACDTLDELARAVDEARAVVESGRRVVLKDAFGVSGKGINVVDDPKRLDRLHRMVTREAGRGDGQLAIVLEEWVAKDTDLNYQFTIGTKGDVTFDFVKRAVTESGVHKGHRMPAGLTDAQLAEVHRATELLGARLAADGYFGVVGVDAMLDPAGGVYPVTEINARNNMSTYQATLTEQLVGDDAIALAKHYELKISRPLGFAEVRTRLDGLLLDRPGGVGLVVNAFATVNAAASTMDGHGFAGRLYGVVVARTPEELADLDARIEGAIDAQ